MRSHSEGKKHEREYNPRGKQPPGELFSRVGAQRTQKSEGTVVQRNQVPSASGIRAWQFQTHGRSILANREDGKELWTSAPTVPGTIEIILYANESELPQGSPEMPLHSKVKLNVKM